MFTTHRSMPRPTCTGRTAYTRSGVSFPHWLSNSATASLNGPRCAARKVEFRPPADTPVWIGITKFGAISAIADSAPT